MTDKTYKLLIRAGIPSNLSGFDFIGAAVELCNENENYIFSICKNLYPAISNQFNNTSPSRVERNIRYAIEKCFANCILDDKNKSFLEDLFETRCINSIRAMSNKAFISYLVRYFQHTN